MYIYFINFGILIFLHFLFKKNKKYEFEKFIWAFVIFLLTIFIGFRFEVGGDWGQYEKFFYDAQNLSLLQSLSSNLVYVYINKFAYYFGIQFYGVNLICASIFMFSLAFFLNDAKNRWLALAIAFPIIILILGMGYIRQGLAFSFSLFLIKSLEEKKLLNSLLFYSLSVLTHKSAIFISSFLLFIFLWYHKRYFFLLLTISIPTFFALIFKDFYLHNIYNYIGEGQHMFSYGSLPRSFLILLIAILFLSFRNKFENMSKYQIFVFSSFSWMIIFLFPFCIVTSIVTDRLLLYLYTLKLVFISNVNLNDKTLKLFSFLIIFGYLFYLILWISFGINSISWLPYKFIGFN